MVQLGAFTKWKTLKKGLQELDDLIQPERQRNFEDNEPTGQPMFSKLI